MVGSVWTSLLLLLFIKMHHTGNSDALLSLISLGSDTTVDYTTILITLSLLEIQDLRRLYETFTMSKFGSHIGILHYIWGLVFYTLLGPTVLATLPENPDKGKLLVTKKLFWFLIILFWIRS